MELGPERRALDGAAQAAGPPRFEELVKGRKGKGVEPLSINPPDSLAHYGSHGTAVSGTAATWGA